MIRSLLILLLAPALSAATVELDSSRGKIVFETEACSQCHAVGGEGGHVAPDLGRVIDRDFTPAGLASTMWNHAPTMWAKMQQQSVKRSGLDQQAATDLFAYFYSVHFFDKRGDAGRGKHLFHQRTCDTCHGLTTSPNPGAPPVSQWKSLTDPIELTQAMWNHAGSMYAELQQKKMAWPQLSSQDLSDLLVYFRNLPGATPNQTELITTAGKEGEALFASKGCKECHEAGTLLFRTELSGRTLTDIAAALWDHAPRMKTPPAQFSVNEMRELLSYLWADQFLTVAGIPDRGKKIFAAKHCAACHDDPASGAPSLSKLPMVNGATMVSVLWKHGPQMLEQMNQKKIKWPHFEAFEMADVISYLNSGKK